MKKFIVDFHAYLSREVLFELENIQTEDCKTEMQYEMRMYIPTIVFSSHAERLLAEDMFKKAWLCARYLKREVI